ncbi:MAG TPA: PAS domain S-box protein [Verrucomicrobiae bacterium]|nr:PAS domain S-box protein [Verrucomicrobiae bacterium]
MTFSRKSKKQGLFEDVLETAPFPIYEIDYNTPRFLRVNQATCKISGYTKQELLSMDPSALLDAESAQRFKDRIKRGLAGQKIDELVEFKLKAKDGRDVWAVLQVKPTYKDGKLDSALVAAYDISERKKAEEVLRKAKEQSEFDRKRLETILEATPAAVVIIEAADGRFSFVNRRAMQLYGFDTLGLDLKENVAKVKARRADGSDYPIEEMPASRSLKLGLEVHNEEMIIENAKGKAFPIMASTSPLRDMQGNITAAIVVWEDIAERKKTEAALQESLDREHLLADLVRSASVAVAVGYADGTIGMVNRAFERLTGYTQEELSKISWNQTLTPPEYQEFERGKLSEINVTKKPVTYEKEYIRKDGSRVPIELVTHPFLDKEGNVTHYFAFINDITERKKSEEALKDSESKYHSLFANMMDGFAFCQMIFDDQGRPDDFIYLEINDAFERLTGLRREKIIGRRVSEAIPGTKEANPEIFEIYGRVAKTGNPERFELYFKPLTIWLDIAVYCPKKGYFVAVFENITERKKAEQSLIESEERWSTTLSSIGDAVIATDVEGNITFMNKVAEALTGYSWAEATKKPLQKVFHIINEETRSDVENPVTKVLQKGAIVGLANHSVLVGRFGKEVPIDDSGSPIRDQTGQVTGVVLVFHDISERKKTESQLERQAKLINLDPNAIIIRKPDGAITFWSEGAKKLYGYTKKEALGQVAHKLLRTKFPAGFTLANILIQIQKTGDWSGEIVHRTKDGCEVIVQSHWVSSRGENNKLEFLESNVDVTDRVLLQQRLEEKAAEVEEYATRMEELVEERTSSVKRQASLIDLTPDAIMVRGFDGCISFWSAGAEKLYGWTAEEAIGRVSHDLLKTIFPVPLHSINATIRVKGSWTGELRHKTKDGRDVVVESRWLAEKNKAGKIIDVLESNVDITERKKAEAKAEETARKLKDSERLAAIGATAGMVGHDIRNPLQAITGDVYLAKSELEGFPDSEEKKAILNDLEETERNIDYINKIVQDLQDYARPLNPKIEEGDLNQVFEGILKKNGISSNIDVTVRISKRARKLKADSYYLNRIMSNLITNAVQAMPQGGKLKIDAHKQKEETVITVEDTGVGIAKDIQAKMFTVMFTTKSKGQGFGLPVVKRMTEALGGTVTFESEVGKGAKFIVRLPPLKEINGKLVFKQ